MYGVPYTTEYFHGNNVTVFFVGVRTCTFDSGFGTLEMDLISSRIYHHNSQVCMHGFFSLFMVRIYNGLFKVFLLFSF